MTDRSEPPPVAAVETLGRGTEPDEAALAAHPPKAGPGSLVGRASATGADT